MFPIVPYVMIYPSRVALEFRGTDRMQPLTLICNYPNAKIYTLRVNLSGLTVLHVELGLEWALLVAYNRGKMESVRHSPIYNYFADLSKGYDMIAGYIADADRVQLKQEGAANRSKGIAMAEEICRKYRRKGGISGELPASDIAV